LEQVKVIFVDETILVKISVGELPGLHPVALQCEEIDEINDPVLVGILRHLLCFGSDETELTPFAEITYGER